MAPEGGHTRLLILQKRATRAGAQTCLARLLRQEPMRSLAPVVCTEEGWLADELRQSGIEVWIERYPAVRSLSGRLLGNRLFARRLAERFAATGHAPVAVMGNDYQETPLVLALARRMGARSAVLLRSSGMSERDFRKHGCARADLLVPIGVELAVRVRGWLPQATILPAQDGMEEQDFHAPADFRQPPRRFLVIGTEHPDKGWGDLIEAVHVLLRNGNLPEDVGFDFTGDLKRAGLPESAQLCGIGRQDGLSAYFFRYDCVLHPSRRESFGMAAMEAVAAGMPLLSSRTGVAESVIDDPRWLFRPGDSADLARVLESALNDGTADRVQRSVMQDRLWKLYSAERQAAMLSMSLLASREQLP